MVFEQFRASDLSWKCGCGLEEGSHVPVLSARRCRWPAVQNQPTSIERG